MKKLSIFLSLFFVSFLLMSQKTIELCEALDNCDYAFSTGGDSEWFGQNETHYHGGDAAQSGEIGEHQESWMRTTSEGYGLVSFWWKFSRHGFSDRLLFEADGNRLNTLSQTTDWQYVEKYILGEGEHILEWKVTMGSAWSGPGNSYGWVDKFTFTPLENYYLDLKASPPQGGIVATSGEYEAGQQITITANPNQGYQFYNWTDEQDEISTDASYTFTMPDKHLYYTANFNRSIMSIAPVEALIDDDITIEVVIDNTIDFISFGADIILPNGFTYIEGSAKLNDNRITNHVLSVEVLDNNTLRLSAESTTEDYFIENEGSLASFKLSTPEQYGIYTLAFGDNCSITDIKGDNILTATTNGTLDLYNHPLILVFDTRLFDNRTVSLPLAEDVNVTVRWGDGSKENVTQAGNKEHSYITDGVYTVKISGSLGRFGNGWDHTGMNNLIKVKSFGDINLKSLSGAFRSSLHLEQLPDSLPSTVTDLSHLFAGDLSFEHDITKWDVSNVQNMSYIFYGFRSFNQNIGSWVVSNVNDMSSMFSDCHSFNQDIGGWDVSNVSNMNSMFYGASSFDQSLDNWNVSNVTGFGMNRMFAGALAFNGNICTWDVRKVTNMGNMFQDAKSFNQDISGWQTNSLTGMNAMFSGATAFNQNIGGWNVSGVSGSFDMNNLFENAKSFNQNIGGWDVSNVKNMRQMFKGAESFEQDLSSWNVGNVENMHEMFYGASSFTSNINGWNIGNVGDMVRMFKGAANFNSNLDNWSLAGFEDLGEMFYNASSFNGDISTWDVSQATNMARMFKNAHAFNHGLSEWKVENATSMEEMFMNASSFNQDIGSWNVSSVENMDRMFKNAKAFNQNLGGWNISNVKGMDYFLLYATLSTPNYDNLLIGWSQQELQQDIYFHGGSSRYSAGEAADARQYIIDTFNWTIEEFPDYEDLFEAGSGLESDPYIIATAEHLNNVRLVLEAYYKQIADIDLGVAPWNDNNGWEPIGKEAEYEIFIGSFDGNEHTISNMVINRPEENYLGLFGSVQNATLKNIAIENGTITGQGEAGLLSGKVNNTTVENCYSTGNIYVQGGNGTTGGLIGIAENHSSVTLCHSETDVDADETSWGGGLIGQNYISLIENSYATGYVTGGSHMGGLVGRNVGGRINKSYATGDVLSVPVVSVYGTNYTGGLTGSNVGYQSTGGIIENSYATGNISGVSYVGGLTGSNQNIIRYSHATGNVFASNQYAGGFSGYNRLETAHIVGCYATGDVEAGNSDAGGLVGHNTQRGFISHSYSSGKVKAAHNIGGLAGFNRAAISNSYATGTVQGDSNIGGLVGRLLNHDVYNDFAYIENSYSIGFVTPFSDSGGGMIGVMDSANPETDEVIINSYFNKETSGWETSQGGEGKTSNEMLQQINFANWDFDNIWAMADGETYPYLQIHEEARGNNKPQPTKLKATASISQVTLSWNAPANASPASYQIYRNGEEIGQSSVTGFNDNDVTSYTTYTYQVAAIYPEGESALSNIAEATPNTGFAGGDGTKENSFQVADSEQLFNVRYYRESYFIQTEDVDLQGFTAPDNSKEEGLWKPIGASSYDLAFSGSYDGDGYVISNLLSDEPEDGYAGLFGYTIKAELKNIVLKDAEVSGRTNVGALAAYIVNTHIKNCHASGKVTGSGEISPVTIFYYFGGLVGNSNSNSIIEQSSSIGQVGHEIADFAGGLVGRQQYSTISNSYSHSNVNGNRRVGGLLGHNDSGNLIENSYAAGSVTGEQLTGGLVGGITPNPPESVVENSYWDAETTGQTESYGGEGKSTSQMKEQNTFSGWDFENIWAINENESYPYLQNEPEGWGAAYLLTLTAKPADAGIVEGAGEYTANTEVTISAVANDGYLFLNWTLDDESVFSNNATHTFNMPSNDLNIQAIFVEETTDLYNVSLNAEPETGGRLTGDGTYPDGTEVTISATPNNGYEFVSWMEDNNVVSTDTEYTFTISGENRNFTALFSLKTYTITVISFPANNAGGSASGGGNFKHGDEVTIIANPNINFTFGRWEDQDRNILSAEENYTFNVESDMTITAIFEGNTYEITTQSDENSHGQTSGDGIYYHNQTVVVEATAEDGYRFLRWMDGDKQVSVLSTYKFSARQNRELTAEFIQDWSTAKSETALITAMSQPEHIGVVLNQGYHTVNQNITLTASPNVGTDFVKWTENGVDIEDDSGNLTGREYEFPVENNRDLTAIFGGDTYNVELKVEPAESGITSGGGEFYYGDYASISANPKPGFVFDKWTIDGQQLSVNSEYGFSVNESIELVANFKELEHFNLTLIVEPENAGTVSGAGSYPQDTEAEISAEANEGYNFLFWEKNREIFSEESQTTVNLYADITLKAVFTIKQYTLIYNADENGVIQGESTQSVNHGDDGTAVEAIPNAGFVFLKWDDDNTDNPRTDRNITGNLTVKALFDEEVSIEEFGFANFAIYPNPARDIVYIHSDDKIDGMTIVDILGNIVYRNNYISANKHYIDISQLNSGIYFVRIESKTGYILKKLQIVN